MDRNTQQEEIKAHLMQSDEHFRKLVEQHREYDRLVDDLERKPALSAQEEVEEHRLKKLKLHLRTRWSGSLASTACNTQVDSVQVR